MGAGAPSAERARGGPPPPGADAAFDAMVADEMKRRGGGGGGRGNGGGAPRAGADPVFDLLVEAELGRQRQQVDGYARARAELERPEQADRRADGVHSMARLEDADFRRRV